MKKIIIAAALLFCLGASTTVYAGPWPTGQWNTSLYRDTTGNKFIVTRGVCIESGGTFYGTDFVWDGTWFKKGNDLHMHSSHHISQNVGVESTKIAGWHMDGYLQEWSDVSSNKAWVTAKWVKKSNTCGPPAAQMSNSDIAVTAAAE